MNKTITSWKNKTDTLPTITYEELDIMKMEMPPAFRGYGAKGMIIENELSQKRQEEVDEIVSKLKDEGKNRHEIQDKLMQFDLPLNYKELNQRSGVEYE